MGWDITYHPLGAEEITSVYFAGVENPELAQTFAERYGVPEFHHENLAQVFRSGSDDDMDGPFGKYHGMNMAVMAGHLRTYWYVRGSAMSFVYDDDNFKSYFSDMATLVPERYRHIRFDNQLTENYCSGVFMDNDALRRLKSDMQTNAAVRETMEELFSHGRLAVFMAALDYALENGLGLFEASEVVEPNPLDLNNSRSFSNLHNCDPAGAILYHEAAMEQIAAIEAREKAEEESKAQAAAPAETSGEEPKKQGFFSRLFGKK